MVKGQCQLMLFVVSCGMRVGPDDGAQSNL
jgi:hypothetical protein